MPKFGPALRMTLVVVCLAAPAGCGPVGNHAAIHGEVKLDGEPLTEGSILFLPATGTQGSVTGTTIKNGRYELGAAKGPAIGHNRVEITAMRATGAKRHDPMLPPEQTADVLAQVVAARFNMASTLAVDVKPGDNQANFDVQTK